MFTKLPEFRVDKIETAEMFLSKVQNYLNSLEYDVLTILFCFDMYLNVFYFDILLALKNM